MPPAPVCPHDGIHDALGHPAQLAQHHRNRSATIAPSSCLHLLALAHDSNLIASGTGFACSKGRVALGDLGASEKRRQAEEADAEQPYHCAQSLKPRTMRPARIADGVCGDGIAHGGPRHRSAAANARRASVAKQQVLPIIRFFMCSRPKTADERQMERSVRLEKETASNSADEPGVPDSARKAALRRWYGDHGGGHAEAIQVQRAVGESAPAPVQRAGCRLMLKPGRRHPHQKDSHAGNRPNQPKLQSKLFNLGQKCRGR